MNYYSIEEIASLSGYSQKTIRRHIAANKLNADKIDLVYADGAFTPAYTTVFLVPWQKRKKGKK